MKSRIVFALAVATALSGCGIFKGGGKPKTPVLGDRVPVLTSEVGAELDPSIADVPVTVPPAETNEAWAQPGGNAWKSPGNVAVSASPARAWVASIDGSTSRARLAAAPVVAGGRVYVVDTSATLSAFDAQSGAKVWTAKIGSPKDTKGGIDFFSGEAKGNSGALFGGGVSFDEGRVYATNGLGDTAAFDAANGTQIWLKRPGGPLRGAPTIANGHVYVVSQDNQLFALDRNTGDTVWNEAGTLENSGVFGVAAPASAQGTVVAGFSSGELTAYRYENGRAVWQDALSRTSISTAVAALSDIDASPVIDQGKVYAIGQGGRMVAMELVTGQRLWELNVAGIETPVVGGEWLFVVTDDARLLCVARTTGRIRWIAQLPRWRDAEDKKGPISWSGPVLAGDRLWLTSTRGNLQSVSVADGALGSVIEAGKQFYLAPVVANGTLYLLDNDGKLTAWR